MRIWKDSRFDPLLGVSSGRCEPLIRSRWLVELVLRRLSEKDSPG